jgi:hypothetical protein
VTGTIISNQTEFIQLLGQEVQVQAWELFIGVNPVRKEGERKVMVRLCQVRTEVVGACLKELRGKNVRRQDTYLRPSHSSHPTGDVATDSCIAYPYFVLDDVKIETALEIAKRHRCFLVSTSVEGGCQVWIICNRPIDIKTRHTIQSHFSSNGLCDRGATAGTQYFRFPHFKNHKRGGQWVNLIHIPQKCDVFFNVDEFLVKFEAEKKRVSSYPQPALPVVGSTPKRAMPPVTEHSSPSETDWHEVSMRLRAGEFAEDIIADLQPRSMSRGKHHSYARRTVEKAERWLKDNR